MKSELYKVSLISSPLLGLIAAIPAYLLKENETIFFFTVWAILTFFIFIFWVFNIFLIFKFDKNEIQKRYTISYLVVLLFQFFNFFVLIYIEFKPKYYNIFLPFLGAIALNTIIIIIANSIILQYQKESAELEIEQLKVQNLEAQKRILLQQLQPHFLFNTLSTLKSLINENTLGAENYVIKLSDFLRYSIQAKNNEVVSVEEELKFSKDYFDLQKVRFGDALFSKVEIPDKYLQKNVPVYAIQTLVENAIKHNSFTEKKPLLIDISIVDNKIKISNNKLVKKIVLKSGTGLQNLNLRYKMLSNTEIKIDETEEYFSVDINLL